LDLSIWLGTLKGFLDPKAFHSSVALGALVVAMGSFKKVAFVVFLISFVVFCALFGGLPRLRYDSWSSLSLSVAEFDDVVKRPLA
jgi:hypothetical protein